MKIITCENCGVLLDAQYLHFPSDIYSKQDGQVIEDAEWDGEKYIATVSCPVCNSSIRQSL